MGERKEQLQRLIDVYKFSNARAAFRPLATLLDKHLPVLPPEVVVVPIPTVTSHIRVRGYDHMMLIAREFARQRELKVQPVLRRVTSTKQRDASRSVRIRQAKEAFCCPTRLDSSVIYLLLDDVVTTGATMRYAAKCLQDAGATTIWAASISRQTLD